MAKIPESCAPVNAKEMFEETILNAESALQQAIALELTRLLDAIVCYIIGRPYHVRRVRVPRNLYREGKCCRCGLRACHRFSRNGYRKRKVVTKWGDLTIFLPRVRCECGGSVRIDFGGLLRPYQRIWENVYVQIERWGAMALSLRQMRRELGHLHIGPLSLYTLNHHLHTLADLELDYDPAQVPPILQVDAIWITKLRPNGKVKRDRKGRKRPVKSRIKCPLFIAMGIWPESNRSTILYWKLGKSEDDEEWVSFLGDLEAVGIRGENGLKLVIHDGGSGLCSALRTVYFGAAQQRCLFHKFRNIYNALRVPEGLSAKQGRRHRKAVFKDIRAIWGAKTYNTALRRYLKVVRTYRDSQPEAVATLRRDFRFTVAYYDLELKEPEWERRHLRTTSRLERFNRRLRHRIRAACAYHSDQGVLAMIGQEVHEYHAIQAQG